MRLKEVRIPEHADRLYHNLTKITFTSTLRTSIYIGYSNLVFHRVSVGRIPAPDVYCRGIFCSKSFDLDFILDDYLNSDLTFNNLYDIL